MHLHILGICGTFMAGVAQLARELGHEVTGSDANVYPPMSDLLAGAGIPLHEGWDPAALRPAPDLVVVGNALSRGNPAVEYLLDSDIPFTSGPAWLAERALPGRHVLAVAGTHGKTTTSSLLAWLLDAAGLEPGFLIGGIPGNFGCSARLGRGAPFVIEADEYDTAFFDKRPKFLHYRPRTLVVNNVEFDHADIYSDLAAVKQQFHYLLRTVPGRGLVVFNADDANVSEVLERGCWSGLQSFGSGPTADWQLLGRDAGSGASVIRDPAGHSLPVESPLPGAHNALNALAAIAAARSADVDPRGAAASLAAFRGVRRRLELAGVAAGVHVYDDFAHHPTAVRATLAALRERAGTARVLAVLEPRSNTMRLGHHREELAPALAAADAVLLFEPPALGWDLAAATAALGERRRVFRDVGDIVAALAAEAQAGDRVLVMSNGGFGGLHGRLLAALEARARGGR